MRLYGLPGNGDTQMKTRIFQRTRAALFLGLLGIAGCAISGNPPSRLESGHPLAFQHVVVDANGPQDLWLKSVGDLNGDGRPDLIAGGHRSGGLVWYENPTWQKHVIAAEGAFSTDGEAADVDGDGDQDLVVVTDKELVWYENPGWKVHHIDDIVLHDIEVVDLDGDGKPDIAGRDQGAFSHHHGELLHIYRQESPSSWAHRTVSIPDGEGLLVADIDRNGRPDVIVGRVWLENPGDILKGDWITHEYAKEWNYPHVYVATGDINGDGRADIVLAPSERAGGTYRISWFEAPRNPKAGAWKEHVIEDPVETVHHFVGTGDFNGDGRLDVATASMHQGKSPDIRIYVNGGKGRQWVKDVVAPISSHSMRVVDVNGDGLPDLYGGNWQGHQVELWENRTRSGAPPRIGMELWSYRRQLAADLPGTLATIRKLGFTDIETASFYGHTASEFRRLLDSAGLTCSSIIADYKRLKGDMAAVIADAKALGARYVLTAGIPHQGRLTAEDVHRAAADFNDFGAKLREAGLRFGYHPHGFEFVPAGQATLFEAMLAETKPELVTYELDTYHFFKAGADPLKYLKRYPRRFALVHLRDLAKGSPTGVLTGESVHAESVVVGTGMLDWPAILGAAKKDHVDLYYIEDESEDAPDQIPHTIEYLKAIHMWQF
jgi:sugar phosphate isomerase/epimerase